MTTPVPCWTPGKRRFATVEAAAQYAQGRAVGVGTLLAPYACPCGWVHLTSTPQPGEHDQPDPAVVTALRYATHEVFVDAVEADAAGRLALDHRVALRAPRLRGRWVTTLRAILRRLDHELSTRDTDPDWARRASAFRWNVAARLVEAEGLRDREGAA